MAGRKSRSTGCGSCSQRHIKCDGKRPVCLNCKRANFECDGWPTTTDFIAYKPTAVAQCEAGKSTTDPATFPLPPIPHKIIDEDTLFAHLIYVFRDKSSVLARETWVGLGALRGPPTSTSYKALLALSRSLFGRCQHDTTLARRGLEQYVHCLEMVNSNLRKDVLQTADETLLSVTVLGMYEMFFLTERWAWGKHYLGLAALFDAYGPQCCTNGSVFDMFRANRFMILLSSMAKSVPICMTELRWISDPWRIRGVPKDSMDRLLDILVRLIAARHSIADSSQLQIPEQNLWTLLEQWFDVWQLANQDKLQEAPARTLDYPETWPQPFEFATLNAANEYAMYHSVVILVALRDLRSQNALDVPGLASTTYWKAHCAALEIVRSLDYHAQPGHAHLGSLFVLWPLRMARVILKSGHDEERRWIDEQISRASSSHGLWKVGTELRAW